LLVKVPLLIHHSKIDLVISTYIELCIAIIIKYFFIEDGSNLLFSPIAEFSKSELEFIQVEANLLFDIALAANYLDVPRLLDLACQTIGNSIKRKTAQEMMETFDLVPQRRPRSETGAEKSNLSELPKRYQQFFTKPIHCNINSINFSFNNRGVSLSG